MKMTLAKIDLWDALAVWRRNYDVNLRLWRAEVFPPLLEPVVSILAFGWGIGSLIAARVLEIPYLTFVAAGILVVTGLVRAILECTYGAYFRMVYQSTYDAILSTPIGIESLGTGEILWAATKAGFDSLLIMIILYAFGVLHSPLSVFIPCVIIVGATGLAAVALAYTASISSIYQYNYFIALAFSSLWLCGAYFPIDRLPLALQYLSWTLPITSVVDLSRDLMTGRLDGWSPLQAVWILVSALLFGEIALRRLAQRMYP
ncbi:ABC transporter permease [Acidobacteria bacterium AH-259-D05]|nr:ABC transporter permease [Acidobacteria bacterium AH-259-D05]